MSDGSMAQGEGAHNLDRLSGWKHVGTYLERGPRTVQRWERELGLPIHRLRTPNGMAVYAFKSEIDAWLTESEHWNVDRSVAGPSRPGTAARRAQVTQSDLGELVAYLGLICMGLRDQLGDSRRRVGRHGTVSVRTERETVQVAFSIVASRDGLSQEERDDAAKARPQSTRLSRRQGNSRLSE